MTGPEAGPGTGSDGHDRVAERLAYLDSATRRINSALDLAATLRNVCRVLVPTLADAAVVHLRDPLPNVEREPGFPEQLRIHHTDAGWDVVGEVRANGPGRLLRVD
ncbi:serine/threonine protein phosphatase, partial [Kitasatospora sp. NPDC001574]